MFSYIFLLLTFTAKLVQLEQSEYRLRRYLSLICTDAHEIYLPTGTVPFFGDEYCDIDTSKKKNFFSGKAGCYCRPGYARNCKRRCIPTEQCPERHCRGPNEVSINRANQLDACDPICKRLDEKCVCKSKKVTKSNSCFCIEGSARDNNDTCIPIVNCPKKGRRCKGTNEVYLNDDEAPKSEAFCDKFADMEAAMENYDEYESETKSNAGCYCRAGYYRNSNKQCVEQRFCKIKCSDKNAIFLPRGTAPRCEMHCSKRFPNKFKYCLPLLDVPEGCYCKKGFCKNDLSICEPTKNFDEN